MILYNLLVIQIQLVVYMNAFKFYLKNNNFQTKNPESIPYLLIVNNKATDSWPQITELLY